MGCGNSKTKLESMAENQMGNAVIDINELVRAYALDQYCQTATWSQRKIPHRDLVFTPNWDELKIAHGQPEYRELSFGSSGRPNQVSSNGTTNSQRRTRNRTQDREPSVDNQPIILLDKEFQNKSPAMVQHTFRGERKTTSVCEVKVIKGVIFHKGIDIELITYNNNPAGRKFPRTVTLCTQPGDVSFSAEETIPWTMETTRPIAPGCTTVARLNMVEEEHQLEFTLRTSVTVPQRGLRISVRDKDGNFIRHLSAYPNAFLQGLSLGDQVQIEGQTVTFVTEGTARFRFGTKTIEDTQDIPSQHQQSSLYPSLHEEHNFA